MFSDVTMAVERLHADMARRTVAIADAIETQNSGVGKP
jgi:hypothetical protein